MERYLSPQSAVCLQASWKTFLKGFSIAFGMRALIGILGRVLTIMRKKPLGLFSFSNILGEKHVVFRVEAIKLGMFVGSFAGIHRAMTLLFAFWRSKRHQEPFTPQLDSRDIVKGNTRSRVECYVSGVVAAAVSVSFLSHESRRTLALYSMARAFQSLFYSAEERGVWKSVLPRIAIPGTSVDIDVHSVFQKHLDSILFAVSSAQIMYSYVMCPQTLPESYWKFIVKTGPIPAHILEAARHCSHRNYPIPVERLGLVSKLDPYSKHVPCSVLHASDGSCVSFCTKTLESTVKKSWLMYLSLNAFSYVVLGFNRFRKAPINCSLRGLLSTTRSTIFLGFFVSVYQSVICLHRKSGLPDHKLVYWIAGIFSSLSIFIEKKSRREELGLYVFPRAVDSLWLALDLKSLPRAEILIYALSMGFLVYFNEYAPQCLAPMIRSIFKNILPPQAKPPQANDVLVENEE